MAEKKKQKRKTKRRLYVRIAAIDVSEAKDYFKKHSSFRGKFNLAIAAKRGPKIYGVISVNTDGKKFKLGHISTDGSAQIGSLLYGAAWRTAKALGYEQVTI